MNFEDKENWLPGYLADTLKQLIEHPVCLLVNVFLIKTHIYMSFLIV